MGHDKVRRAHADLEHMLAGSTWLVGGQRTAADAYFYGIARWNDFHQVVDRRAFPALNALFERLAKDAAVAFAHAVEHEEKAAASGGYEGHVGLADIARQQRS